MKASAVLPVRGSPDAEQRRDDLLVVDLGMLRDTNARLQAG